MLDGVVVTKILIAMLENLKSPFIDEALGRILQICATQLSNKCPKNFQSMLVQTVAMSFHYNSVLTFQLLESLGATVNVFQRLLQVIPTVKHDFEMRRLIFGLTSIISTPPAQMPALVAQRLPDITKQLVVLTLKMREERLKIVVDNEEHIKEQQEKMAKGEKSEDEDEFVDEEGEGGAGSEDEEDENKILKKIADIKKGGKVDVAEEEDDDDEDDSDYEYTGGEMLIYDSALEDVDELLFVRDALERLNAQDASHVQALLGGLTPEEQQQFSQNMASAQELKDREEVVRKKCEELEEKAPLF